MKWFEVDKHGLAKIIDQRGKTFVLYELIQNSWDAEGTTKVLISLTKESGSRYATLSVSDNSPNGFAKLEHAFTLFAPSEKGNDATKRGRFNLGEKLVLALCEDATIISTTGGVFFNAEGRHTLRRKTPEGSIFTGRIKMTNDEFDECCTAVHELIPPDGIETVFNGVQIESLKPFKTFTATLSTLLADPEGYLRPTTRQTTVTLYTLPVGEKGMIYEMGIPVVETGDSYHVNIAQKVPLNFDRDNVTPAYLRSLRTLVVNNTHQDLDVEQSNMPWVRDALGSSDIDHDAVKSIIKARFGDRVVSYDPSDPEANKLAVSQGYTVVAGGQMSKPEWANVRQAGVIQPAGQVTPSPKPFSPEGRPLSIMSLNEYSEAELKFVLVTKRIATKLLGKSIIVELTKDRSWGFNAAYGNQHLILNRGRLGEKFFTQMDREQLKLLIHEFGHEYSGDHLSSNYHSALCDLGARLALEMIEDPKLLDY